MELLFAILVIAATIAYGVLIWTNVQRGKPWARQIAQIMATLEAPQIDLYPEPEVPSQVDEEEEEEDRDPPTDRLAA